MREMTMKRRNDIGETDVRVETFHQEKEADERRGGVCLTLFILIRL